MSAARSASGNDDALVLDDRLPERLARDGVVPRELERRPRDPDGLRGDHRARALEGAQRRRAAPLHRRSRCRPPRRWTTGGGEPRSASRPFAIRARAGAPRRRGAGRPGTRQSSKTISPVCEARQPSLSSLRSSVSPGVPFGTMKTPWPRWPASGSTVATTTWTSAMPPLPMKTFCPSMTQSSPSLRARVWMERTSLPPLGSVTARAASLMSLGRAEALRAPSARAARRSRPAGSRRARALA